MDPTTMAKRITGLGRGLGALIPQKKEDEPAPSRASVIIDGGQPQAAAPAPAPAAAVPAVAPRGEAVPDGHAALPTSFELPLRLIVPNPDQPRKLFKHRELEDLMHTIREHGIIQPLTVSPREDGKYDLIAGERRFRAASMLGLASVPVAVRPSDVQDKLFLALIENIQREDLNPVEEGEAYRKLITDFSLTQEDVAKKVGKARSTVANMIRLLDLPQEIRDALAEGVIPAGSARAILSLKDADAQLRFFKKLVAQQLTTRDVEEGVRLRRGGSRASHRSPALAAMEEQLRDALGSRVEIKSRGGRGNIIISFFSDEERDGLVTKLSS